MNRDEAKELLLLYRPGAANPQDNEFAEALAYAQGDAELQRWFQEHCALQTVLRDKFKQIPVPEGLKEQIISERQTAIMSPPKRNVVLASICILILLVIAGIAVTLWQPGEDKTFANFQARMVRIVARDYPKMDVETNDPKQIRQVLAQKGGPADYVLPLGLEQVSSTGGAVLAWRGKPVSMVCFNSGKNNNPKEPDLFLFVIKRGDAPGAPEMSTPYFDQRSGFTTASWTEGDKTYLLAGGEDEVSLRNYF